MTPSYSDDRSDPVEVQGNNRSVMPFDVRGRTRATLLCAMSVFLLRLLVVLDLRPVRLLLLPCLGGLGNLSKAQRDGDRRLQLFVLNEEFLVSAGHQPALITSLPFVHTARRYYRLDVLVSIVECSLGVFWEGMK